MNIQEALAFTKTLESTSDSAKLDVELLLMKVLDRDRTHLYAWPEKALSDQQRQDFNALFQRRQNGEPIAYILGERDFWTLNLEVSPSTLIPRPDTETLVERAIDKLSSESSKILDLGTGTGAIALALAHEKPNAQITASDFSLEAVELAKRNSERNALNNVTFLQSDWFENISGQFDLIVSNPPYIDANDEHLAQGDVRYEPKSALVAGEEGLADIRSILSQAQEYMCDGAWILLEHGWLQGEAVRAIMQAFNFRNIETVKDLGGQDRVTEGQYCVG